MADNGTVNENINWPVPGGVGALRAGTLHIRVHDPREEVDIAGDFAAATEPLLSAGARVVYAFRMHERTYLHSVGRTWNDPQIDIVNSDTLLTLTAALYRAWHYAEPGQQIVLVVGDWINLYTDGLGNHSDVAANQWLRAAVEADIDTLAVVTGLVYEPYINAPRPDQPVWPTIVIDGVLRRGALRPGAGDPALGGLMGGGRLASLADSVMRFESVSAVPGKSRTARVSALKSRRGTVEPFDVTRSLVHPKWDLVA